MSSTLYMWKVISFLYAESHQHFCNLTDMHWKPSACFGLCISMVPKVYQHRDGVTEGDKRTAWGWHVCGGRVNISVGGQGCQR
jgi:hypothetical protein